MKIPSRECKFCSREFLPRNRSNVYCSEKCRRAETAHRRRNGEFRCFIRPTIPNPKDRELSSTQLWYIAQDVSKGINIENSAADFGWRGNKGFSVFKSKLKEKKQEFERYLKAAREQKKAKRCG